MLHLIYDVKDEQIYKNIFINDYKLDESWYEKTPNIILENLEKEGLIKSNFYFNLYLILTGNYKKLQAGKYLLSSSMAASEITKKFVSGDIIKIKVVDADCYDLYGTLV